MFIRLRNPSVILSIVPALLALVGVVLLYNMYPIHINSGIGFGQDPAYQYLFAGVDILQGHAPLHTDHPGTPLQTLIAGIIASSWFALWLVGVMPLGLFDSVLRSPEIFLGTTSAVLLVITSAANFYFGRRVYQVTQQYSIALTCQFTPLLYVAVIPNVVYPTPEALLLALSLTLMGVLAPVVLSAGSVRRQFSQSTANWAGVICGLGVATKLTFVPLLGLLLLLRAPRLILRACCMCILAWLVGVLPIWSRLGTMFQWFYSLLMNSGIHGAGERTVFSAQQLQSAIGWLLTQFSFFYYVVAAVGCLLILGLLLKIFQKITTNVGKENWSSPIKVKLPIRAISGDDLLTAIVFLLVCAVQTLMVAKHLGPGYMVPALPLTLLAFAWLLNGQQLLRSSNTLQKVFGLCCLAVVLWTAAVSTTLAIRSLAQDRQKGLNSYAAIQQAIARYDQPLLIGAFNCNFAECALWFGMSLVPEMELKMASVTPNFYYYDIFNKTLRVPGKGELSHQQTAEAVEHLIQQTRPVLLISPPFPQLSQLKLELVTKTPVNSLYRVHGLANATKP
jgi:hypothetical protein